MSRDGSRGVGVAAALLLASGVTAASAQQSVSGGARQIMALDFTAMPIGDFPKRKDLSTNSSLEIVDKDGVHMLRAGFRSEFVINLPENLPDLFTLEFEVISQECCGSDDLGFETTKNDPTQSSAKVTWSPALQAVSGGGGNPNPFTATTKLTGGQLAHVLASVEGTTIKMYTDNDRLYTATGYRLARGQVLRVSLNGTDEKKGAVYLARVRVAEGAATVTQIAATGNGSGAGSGTTAGSAATGAGSGSASGGGSTPTGSGSSGGTQQNAATEPAAGTAAVVHGVKATVGSLMSPEATVSWQSVQGATTYFVMRWKDGSTCCVESSSPLGTSSLSWQDGGLSQPGIYRYRVYAHTPSLIYTGETTVQYPASLEAVALLNLQPHAPLGILLAWGPVANATTYRVYRQADATQSGVVLGTVPATSGPTSPFLGGLPGAVDAEVTNDAGKYQYWVQAGFANGSSSEPGPVTRVTVQGGNSPPIGTWGVSLPIAPANIKATPGGTTTITVNGQQVPGSKVVVTWDQDLDTYPVYLYFTTVESAGSSSGFGTAWVPYKSETVSVPGTPLIPYLNPASAVGPPYTVEVPAGMMIRVCVSYFPLTPDQRQQYGSTACAGAQIPQ